MKIDKFYEIFPDHKYHELNKVLTGGVKKLKEIDRDNAIRNLLQANNPQLEASFLNAVQKCRKFDWICDKLKTDFADMKAASNTEFPKESCLLSHLHTRKDELEKDKHKLATVLSDEIKKRIKKDPLVVKDSHYSLKGAAGLIKSSDVKTKHQDFVLSCCPRTVKAARHYFEQCLRQNTTVFVSLLESHEATSRCNNFWSSKVLHSHPDFGGIIKSTTSKVWAQRKQRIVETEILFSNGKKATFFHHEGWKDHFPAPDRHLLASLVNHVLKINGSKDAPIAVNCRGGVGRTAVFAVTAYLRREVDAQLASGVPLSKISINIPEALYLFKRQREELLGNRSQLVQLYAIMHDYYLELLGKT